MYSYNSNIWAIVERVNLDTNTTVTVATIPLQQLQGLTSGTAGDGMRSKITKVSYIPFTDSFDDTSTKTGSFKYQVKFGYNLSFYSANGGYNLLSAGSTGKSLIQEVELTETQIGSGA